MQPAADIMVNDKLRLIDRLGIGSMGEVWLAYHSTLRTEVAVKFISEETSEAWAIAAERFSLEASAAARIRSPHVVQAFDHGTMADGTPFIVMELLEGDGLGDLLKGCQTLSLDKVATILSQVGKALDAAHGLGIIHRDIKPDNIFLTQSQGEMFVKVLDFGAAKETYMSDEARRTAPGMLLGSPGYLSGDQLLDPDQVSYRFDLWALGVVIYKSLTGRLPFGPVGADVSQICAAIVEGNFQPPSQLRPELPPACDDWFVSVFHADPKKRPASCAEMTASFVKAAGTGVPGSVPEPAAVSPVVPAPGRRGLWALLVLAPLFGGALAAAVHFAWLANDAESGAVTSGSVASSADPSSVVSPGSAANARAIASSIAASAAEPVSKKSAPPAVTLAPTAVREEFARQRLSIAAGPFWMGCDSVKDQNCGANEKPGRTVQLAGFRIDRTEVTVGAYTRCVNAGVCTKAGLERHGPPKAPNRQLSVRCNWGKANNERLPINCVDHQQANTFCRWLGAQLPSEAQWEKAARGTDKRSLPWGGMFASCTFAVLQQGAASCRAFGTAVVGSKPGGASPYRVLNTAGNVREWTADWYGAESYKTAPEQNPSGPEQGTQRVVRGGCWGDVNGRFARTSARQGMAPDTHSVYVGFRCAVAE